jgi:citrate lyase subunit beta / citryl-CoA lyase
MITGLRRSLLYVPGDSLKMLQKAITIPADVLVLNLEDGVAASQKDEARANVVWALKSLDFGSHEVVVRVNNPTSEVGRRDVAASVPGRPDGICLPKIESAGEIERADSVVRELEVGCGLPSGSLRFHAMIESSSGVLNAPAIARSSMRMASLVFGSADYSAQVRCQPSEDRLEILMALQLVVASARSAGIDAIDAPCFDVADAALLRRESMQGRRLGFDGKSALGPGQVGTINEIFDVTAEEAALAERVLAALDGAELDGRSLTTIDGSLVDDPHRTAATRILRRWKELHH